MRPEGRDDTWLRGEKGAAKVGLVVGKKRSDAYRVRTGLQVHQKYMACLQVS